MTALLKWLIFSVILAVIPIGFTYIHLLTDGKPPTLPALIAHGELALISFILAADAVGDLIASGKEKQKRKIVCGGGCVLTAIAASLYFAHVSLNSKADPNIVFSVSLWIFGFAVIASGMCKVWAGEIKQ
jgi:hypothetical protein